MDFIDQILTPFIVGTASSAVVVLFGVRSIKAYIDKREHKKAYGLLETFWTGTSSHRTYHIVYGAVSYIDQNEPDPLIRYSITYGVSQIINTLHLVFGAQVKIGTLYLVLLIS